LTADLVSAGKITVEDPANVELQLPISLDQGERDSLLLALEMENALIATDDRKAIKAATFMNVRFTITP